MRFFLRMSVEKRLRAVVSLGYCPNCLAHKHSGNNCRQDTGCHICSKGHHTLLHFEKSSAHNRQHNSARYSRSRGITPSCSNGRTSVSTILSRHVISLLPTVKVIIVSTHTKLTSRALIDVCSQYSRIEQQLVNKLHLKTYKFDNETYCQLMLSSKIDPQIRLAVDARIVSQLAMKTPLSSLSSTIVTKFSHLMPADNEFYISQSVSLVLGNESYSKILKAGVIPGEGGLPMAQDTIFGWVLSNK